MNDPQISVVMANYNHARLLPRSLGALLAQTVPPLEIIVVNDASADNSREVLDSLARKHPLIRVLHNECNLGVNETYNRGLVGARGDYVLFSAADDEVRPILIERSLEMLRAHPQSGLCTGICEWHCESTGMTWYMGGDMPKVPCYISPEQMVSLSQRSRLAISAPNAVYRKAALLEAGSWHSDLRWFSDWFGSFVIGFRQGMCHVPEVLSRFNLSATSYYQSAESIAQRRETLERILVLFESEKYADVAPYIRRSGILGAFGWPVVRVVGRRCRFWKYANLAFFRRVAWRCAEATGRRILPRWIARFFLRKFYRAQ